MERISSSTALLFHACAQGDLEQVSALLEEGLVDVNATNDLGDTALHFATGMEFLELMELLLSYGADPEMKEHDSIGGATPLLIACHRHAMEAAELLLNHKANINVQDSLGFSPLHYAARDGDLDLVHLLIAKGATLDLRDSFGKTPYTHAMDELHEDIAKLLPVQVYSWLLESQKNIQFVDVALPKDALHQPEKKGEKGKKGKKGKKSK